MNPLKAALQFALPLAILFATRVLLPKFGELPPGLTGMKVYGVYFVIILGVMMGLVFRRGRIVFALVTLALAYMAYGAVVNAGLTGFRAHTLFAAMSVFVPLNLALFCVSTERGIFNVRGGQRILLIAAELLFTWWVIAAPATRVTAWTISPFVEWNFLALSPVRPFGWLCWTLALSGSIAAWALRRAPLDAAFIVALIAFALGMHNVGEANAFALYLTAAALVLTVALIEDSFRMAFRDELTGLPSRRNLNERLMGLGRRYTIAMCDVDHFKQFNDTHGHDLGDQVLKMVAAKLSSVTGGGTAFRYGGEEFTVLFPGKDVAHALPHLEALRASIEKYKIALRAPDRPGGKAEPSTRRRGAYRDARSVAVTISIGVAERTAHHATPDAVIKAADKALYRAKNKGRNQVSE